MSRSLVVNSQIVVPASELVATFVRSSGPGGQNVNKVNSKAQLRWNVRNSPALSEEVKLRFEACFPTRVNQSGEVVVVSDKHRDQGRNLTDCYERLRQLILAAIAVPKSRKKSRPTRGSVEDRLLNKRRTAQIKKQRNFRNSDET